VSKEFRQAGFVSLGETRMNQFLVNPWLGLCTLASVVIVACTAIVFITDFLQKSRQSAFDAYLKQDMLSRGMSAADIKAVLECSSDGEAMRLALSGNQGVQVGLGKFHLKVGDFRKSAAELPDNVAAAKC
jgi:hypothetical protein